MKTAGVVGWAGCGFASVGLRPDWLRSLAEPLCN
jgi:hypothetical protein